MNGLGRAAFVVWLLARLFVPMKPAVFGVSTAEGELPFLYVDASWLLLALTFLSLRRAPLGERETRLYVLLLSFASFVATSYHAFVRYYGGHALAWDLANFVQPMWRFTAGQGLDSSWHGGRPLWGDHGSFALYAFAPFTRLFDDAATGPLLIQAALSATFIPALYALARTLALSEGVALACACAAFATRSLAYAASFDFHPECALPSLLAVALIAQARRKTGLFVGCVLAAALLKDMAALTLAAACTYLALRDRDRRSGALALCAGAIAAVDVAVLPRLTGWASYVALNTGASVDAGLALKTTLMRALSTGGLLGALSPFGLVAGAPWTLAAALSPKILVKGVQFQYAFFFASTSLLGAVLALRWLQKRGSPYVALVFPWALLCVAVSAPRAIDLSRAEAAHTSFEARRASLASMLRDRESVATDACTAPYVMERPSLVPLCQIDTATLAESGRERWDAPDPRALSASLLLLQPSCAVHGACLKAQVSRALEAGFRVVRSEGGYLALRRETAATAAQR